jgi:hypothetical protein
VLGHFNFQQLIKLHNHLTDSIQNNDPDTHIPHSASVSMMRHPLSIDVVLLVGMVLLLVGLPNLVTHSL